MRSKSSPSPNRQNGRRSTMGDERRSDLLAIDTMSVPQVHRRKSSGASVNNGGVRAGPSSAVSGASSMSSVTSANYQHRHYESRLERATDSLERPSRIKRNEFRERETSYGKLEISLRYDPRRRCLQCKVHRARNLQPMDIDGFSDPFCMLNIVPVTTTKIKLYQRTKTVHNTLNPEFNERLDFYEISEADMSSGRALHVLILQDDNVARDFLGEVRFPLYTITPGRTIHYNVSLKGRYEVPEEKLVWGSDFTNGKGTIRLTLRYSTLRGALIVTVHHAMDLISTDSNGFSDPSVKLCLTKETSKDPVSGERQFLYCKTLRSKGAAKTRKLKSHLTAVKWKTLNPYWNEEFVFATTLNELKEKTLVIWVTSVSRCQGFVTSHDYLGGLTISCKSKGARLRQWIDVMKFPDHDHRAIHNLTGERMVLQ